MRASPCLIRKSLTPVLPRLTRRSLNSSCEEEYKGNERQSLVENSYESSRAVHFSEDYRSTRLARRDRSFIRQEYLPILQEHKDNSVMRASQLRNLTIRYRPSIEKKLFDINSDRAPLIRPSHRRIRSDNFRIGKPYEEGLEGSLTKFKICLKLRTRCENSATIATQTEEDAFL